MCGPHQSDGNSTLDVSACSRLGLTPHCGQATGYPLQGSRCLHTQQFIHQGQKEGEVPLLMESCLQVYLLICPLGLLQALLRGLLQMGLSISFNDTHVVNTVSPILSDVTDQEVSLLLRGLWRQCVVPIGRTYGPGLISLRHLRGATCKKEGVVAHVRGGKCYAG